MTQQIPPIVTLAERLLKDIERAVHGWARYHKYTHGTRLREQAYAVAQLTHRVWRNPQRRGALLQQLVDAVDDLKFSLQLGAMLKCFASFAQFEAIARAAAELGRQVGGWFKDQHRKGQNASAPPCAPQRAQILSPLAASSNEATR